MKQLILIGCVIFLISCSKEKAITPSLEFENIFAIDDHATGPVQKRVFNIYEKYKIPVFFNDTIGQVFIMNDVQGKPIYNTEKVDLAWTFYDYAKQTFEFEYMTGDEEKNMALDIIETYLEDASPALRPFSFFVTRSGKKFDKGTVIEEYKNGSFLIGFRTVYMTGNWTDTQVENMPALMKRQMVLDKIINYPDDIAAFSAVSKSTWYGGLYWNELDPAIPRGWDDVETLYDDWAGARWYTEEELAAMRINARRVIGKFGFIKGNTLSKGLRAPKNATDDMRDYVTEMLKYSPVEFRELWGAQPLVMRKYSILSNVIENKMQVKL